MMGTSKNGDDAMTAVVLTVAAKKIALPAAIGFIIKIRWYRNWTNVV